MKINEQMENVVVIEEKMREKIKNKKCQRNALSVAYDNV